MSNLKEKIKKHFTLCEVLTLEHEVEQKYLYIVSSFRFKFGDWVINPNGFPDIFGPDFQAQWSRDEIFKKCKKIIATTNPTIGNMSKEGVLTNLPLIPTTFIEKLKNESNKGNIVENVFVEFYPDGFLKYDSNELGIDWDSEEDMTGKPKVNGKNQINVKIKIDKYTKEDILLLMEMWEESQEFSNLKYGLILPQSFDVWLKENL